MAHESTETPGAEVQYAFRGNAAAWGGAAAACGAGHGIEPEGDSMVPDRALIENDGLAGNIARLPGQTGNLIVGGELGPVPLYYDGVQQLIARVMGTAGAGVQQGGETAYKHSLRVASSLVGIYGTLVKYNPTTAIIEEFPHVKLTGLTITIAENKQGSISFSAIASEYSQNIGAAVLANIVASVTPANGARTVAAQPTTPSPLSIVITDTDVSITEYILTMVGTDRDDNVVTEVYQLTVNGLTYTTSNIFKTVTSITASGLAGTAVGDTLTVGVSNGANNATAAALITLPSTLTNPLVFSQCKVLCGDQATASPLAVSTSAADSDEIYPSEIMVGVDRQMEGAVTTKRGFRVDEPIMNGFLEVTCGFKFPGWNATNNTRVKENLWSKPRKRLKIICTGPLSGTTVPYSLVIWIQGVQFLKGVPVISGPGRRPLDVEGKAHRVLTAANGFPDTRQIAIDIVNATATDALSNA